MTLVAVVMARSYAQIMKERKNGITISHFSTIAFYYELSCNVLQF